jgi:hypothetical protein
VAASVALVTVASPGLYVDFAQKLMASAKEFFLPGQSNGYIVGIDEGWPGGTMFRYHRILQHMPDADYVFLIDADARFEALVGPEVLPKEWMTATLHPGYVGKPAHELPFEDREESRCYVPLERRRQYVCGGFLGGTRRAFEWFARAVVAKINADLASGITPVWHDESAVNAVIAGYGDGTPDVLLSPSYCMPDNDQWYRTWWPEPWERRIVMLDKTPEQRGGR